MATPFADVGAEGGGEDGAVDPISDVVGVPGAEGWEARATRGACGWVQDNGIDGTLDDREDYEFEPDGDEVHRHDYGADGSYEWTERSIAGPDGRVARGEVEDAHGALESVYRYEWDDLGRLVEESWDFYNPSTTDGAIAEYISRYGYDEQGRFVTTEFFDGSFDGEHLRGVDTISYDADGLGFVRTSISAANVPLRTERARIALDERGRLVRDERDFENDGVFDFARTYRYDADGRCDRAVSIFDGGWRVFDYRYDELGRLVDIDFDDGGDGVLESRWTYLYDCGE
jgi:YD repeat-containing protein